MTTALSAVPAALVAHPYGWGWGPGPWVLIFPFLWFLFFAVVITLVLRRRAGWCGPGWAGRGYGPGYGPGSDPFQTLGERYARGEIDDEEYRRRLEVLKQGHQP